MGRFNGQSVSIIIPVYQDSLKLKRTIWSIEQTLDYPAELIVSKAEQCVAKNRNAGLAKAKGDLIVFMDDDVILPPFWLSKMGAALASSDKIGVVSAKMTNPDLKPQNDLARVPEGKLCHCLPPGTCFLYHKDKLNGCEFDEEYEASQWEDTDFMVQVKDRGLHTVASGDVWILHDNNWTGHTPQTWHRNKARFVQKWPEYASELGLVA